MANVRTVIDTGTITYRQLDYWTREGYIKARPRPPGAGSGYPRKYTDKEMAVAVRMARLVDRGFTPLAAAKIARRTPGRVHLGQGVTIIVEDLEEKVTPDVA